MDLGANFAAKLEPFLLMAKSAKGAAAAKLIHDATSAPGVYVFSELLAMPSVQELGKSEQHEPYLSLLQLFAYKTYQDYVQHQDKLPALNPAQIMKLKHLSIVSLAAERRILPYSDLLRVLDMPTVRELEDLVIDAIYLDVVRGKLDQKEAQFEVEYTMGRDLEPGKLESILAALQNWTETTSAVLATLDVKIESIAAQTAAKKASNEEYEKVLYTTLKDVSEKAKEKGGVKRGSNRGDGGPSAEKDGVPMDVDDMPEPTKGKNRKASQEAVPKQRKRNKI
ncbi:hypothetical protein AMATHDRAFT_160038 [Amanita thiersii Skay4041]|uniref:PCI domain-containing protein n=1 Tax=Amanita thiersii Skay4041 TaxID=703135 RepID=A0A2A9NCH8_9AGAR|nr:hypothetical protein AMATHDRAFT_160038 [Amanita thiersii Skay4041]